MEELWDHVDPGTSGTVLTCGMCTWHCTGGTGMSHSVLCAGREEVTASILLPALSPLWPQFSCSDFFLGDWSASPHPPPPFAPFSAVKSPVKDLLLIVSKYFWNGSQVCYIPSRWPKPLSAEDPGMSYWGICFARVIQFLCKLLFCCDVLQVRSSVQVWNYLAWVQQGWIGHACSRAESVPLIAFLTGHPCPYPREQGLLVFGCQTPRLPGLCMGRGAGWGL